MAFRDFFTFGRKPEVEIDNKAELNKKTPIRAEIMDGVYKQQLFRTGQDMRTLNTAIQAAEAVYFPNRFELYRIYHNIAREAQVASLVQSRKLKAMGKKYQVLNRLGRPQKELTLALESTWFQDILGHAWDSIMWGYSLVQLHDIVDGKVESVTLVPRLNVNPEAGVVTSIQGATDGTPYADNEWVLPIGDPYNLGLYAKVARPALNKLQADGAWGQMIELFGTPMRIGKTNMADRDRAEGMYKMLANMSGAGYGVFDKDDELEFVETTKGGGTDSAHKTRMDYLDAQISKVIFGQTMTSDNGSSRAQAEVHERTGEDYTLFDLRYLENAMNDVVFPRLVKLGLLPDGSRFEYLPAEDTATLFDMTIQALGQAMPVDLKWFEEKFGIPMVKQDNPVQNTDTNGDGGKGVAAKDEADSTKDSESDDAATE